MGALVYDSPVTGTIRRYTYREPLHETERAAAMLACAQLGVIHSVVFGGFAPSPEQAKRIDDAAPRLVLTPSCGIEGGRTIAYKPLFDETLAADLTTGRDID